MRAFIIGSKELSVIIFEVLQEQGHEICGVLSRDSANDMKIWLKDLGHRSLEKIALENNVPVYKRISVNSDKMLKMLTRSDLDIIFSTSWHEIIKSPVLELPRLGVYNIHTALLPKNRGCWPVSWPIINDEKYTGITVHKMSTGVDDGHIVAQKKLYIKKKDTAKHVYNNLIALGKELFVETLPTFADMTFKLKPQDEDKATYHSRGCPYGGQINPYWSREFRERFVRAIKFDPFKNMRKEPERMIAGKEEPGVRVLIGLDCDRPRGVLTFTTEGKEMANKKYNMILSLTRLLDELEVNRTWFLCGQFLESLKVMQERYKAYDVPLFGDLNSPHIELAEHGYSHNIVKAIPTRPNKVALKSAEVIKELEKTKKAFIDVFGHVMPMGFRTPLGHFEGLKGKIFLLNKLNDAGVLYVSSDLRDHNHSIQPLFLEKDILRQPYRYENGMLEIPTHGWQDTAFTKTKTELFDNPPKGKHEISDYYIGLFNKAKALSKTYERDIFLGLTWHPYDMSQYDPDHEFLRAFISYVRRNGGSFHTYRDVWVHYMGR